MDLKISGRIQQPKILLIANMIWDLKNLKGKSQPTKEKKPAKKRKVLPDTKLTTINEAEEGGRTQRKKMPQNWPTLN